MRGLRGLPVSCLSAPTPETLVRFGDKPAPEVSGRVCCWGAVIAGAGRCAAFDLEPWNAIAERVSAAIGRGSPGNSTCNFFTAS